MRYGLTLGLCTAVAAGGLLLGEQALQNSTTPRPALVTNEHNSYRSLVQRVLPAVVSVEATPKASMARMKMHGPGNPFENMPDLPERFRKQLEEFQRQPGIPHHPTPAHAFGSGFVVDPKGIVLTNDHVVRGADRVQVTLQDGRKFVSHDIKHDAKTDLAIVRIDAKEPLPYLELGDSDAMEIGDRVLAVGAPLGLTGSVTSGIISAKARDIHMNMYEDFLQTDAAINPGNSGGPLVNLAGQVIGINSAIKSETGGFQGIGLAISSNLVKNVMAQLLKDGSVHRGYLGVQVGVLAPEVASRLGVEHGTGVVVSKVTAGAPAARAGLLEGDIVTAVAGRPVKDTRDLQKIIAGLSAGKPVELVVLRDGVRKTLSVTIEEQPRELGSVASTSPEPSEKEFGPTSLDRTGIKVVELDAERAKALGFAEKTEGVLIVEVDPESMAARAGLTRNMLIAKVDHVQVRTVEQARQALAKGSFEKGILLQVKSPHGGIAYVVLKNGAGE
jgi:serine protease Do